ncbi:hypothetical protein A0H76_2123 [Hepatospora eriocheir]|uniref:Uncharacterized protein n=1 Tax=Hepatospora eriocheir TaxID=1081669 RepID=A0A1X0QFU6_9MICR|nr:hypothetical protein HERIO_581 [Hepatospora eriocheir]ORD98649.1 hypothetical protein A0H76_2123 [Hepatospora eriocheir]
MDKDLKWITKPEVNIPNYYKLELEVNKDNKKHDDRLDNDFKKVYIDPLEVINISVLDEILNFESKKLQFLKETDVIDRRYFVKKSERSEAFKRIEQHNKLTSVFNYQRHLQNSFNTVDEKDNDVIEEYPLFLNNENYILVSGLPNTEFEFFNLLEEGDVKSKVTVNGSKKSFMKQKSDKYLIISIKDGNGYFNYCDQIHKLF